MNRDFFGFHFSSKHDSIALIELELIHLQFVHSHTISNERQQNIDLMHAMREADRIKPTIIIIISAKTRKQKRKFQLTFSLIGHKNKQKRRV